MNKRILNLLVSLGMVTVLAGCSNASVRDSGTGNTAPESASATESVSDVEDVQTAGTTAEEDVSDQDNEMEATISAAAGSAETISDEEATVSSGKSQGNENEQEQDAIRNYSSLKDLLSDAECLVKAEVMDSETRNVRSYIYTSYTVEVVDTLYGEVQESSYSLTNGMSGPVLTVNLPGGTLEGEAASAMQKEVTEGKDAGNLPDTDSISSDGNTDRLLQKGDAAYLFLVPESEEAYAVAGEYKGVAFVDNNKVILNAGISDADQELSEEDFINLIRELVGRTSTASNVDRTTSMSHPNHRGDKIRIINRFTNTAESRFRASSKAVSPSLSPIFISESITFFSAQKETRHLLAAALFVAILYHGVIPF